MRKSSYNELEQRVVSKIFLQSLGVYILSDIAYTAGPLVDAIVTAGWLGVDAVAANALVMPSMMFLTFLATMLAGGSRSMYTELLGKGKLDEANSVFTLANIAAAVSSVIMTVLVIVFSREIMGFLGASGKNAHLAGLGSDYLISYSLGLVFLNCGKIIHGYMNIDSDGRRTVYGIATMTLVNIAGDFYVVLFTDWGMFGLGAATSFSSLVYFIILAMHFLKKKRLLHLNLHCSINPFAVIYEVCSRGSMAAVTRLSKAAAEIMMNYIITFYASSIAIAVYGVQKQIRICSAACISAVPTQSG